MAILIYVHRARLLRYARNDKRKILQFSEILLTSKIYILRWIFDILNLGGQNL